MWRYGIEARNLEAIVVELKNDAVRFKEAVLTNMLNNSTSTTYTETTGKYSYSVTNTGGDSVALLSTSHTREDGGTNWSNQITDGTTANMSFDYPSWKAARKVAKAILGGVGELLDINLTDLIFKSESAAHHRAQEVLKSLKEGVRPGTANRDGSIDSSYEIIKTPWLSSATAWGAIDKPKLGPKFGLQLKEGMPMTIDPQFIDYDTKEFKYSVGMDFAYGFNDVRNTLWSTGLNA